MPGFDGTGPDGGGPLTGRGLGLYRLDTPFVAPENIPVYGRGMGRRRGRGFGRGRGRFARGRGFYG